MEVIKVKELMEVFDELEKRYGPKWYEHVHVAVNTDMDGTIRAVVTPIIFKVPKVKELKSEEHSSELAVEKQDEHLQKTLPVIENLEEKLKEYENPRIHVTVSEDEMKAYVTIIPGFEKEVPTVEELMKVLIESGVVYGIKKDVLEGIVEEKLTYQQVLVAEGVEPTPPVDAMIDYKFNTSREFTSFDEFPRCDEGQVLAEKIPPKDGEPGKTVTGKELPSQKGMDFDIRKYAGENTKVVDDKIIATIKVQPYVDDDGVVHVRNVLVIGERDLEKSQKIDFPGTIIVTCNVDGAFKITAGKDLSVNGLVSGSVRIKAGGDVYIKGGFFGRGKGAIVADGSVTVQFVTEGLVIAQKDVNVQDYIMNSDVIAGRTVKVTGEGLIVGGNVKAVELIEAKRIGNEYGVATNVEVGIDFEYETTKAEITHRLKLLLDELSEAGGYILKLRVAYEKISGATTKKEQLKSLIVQLEARREQIIREINELRQKLKVLKHVSVQEALKMNPRIIIKETCFAGVTINIIGEVYKTTFELGPRALNLQALKELKYQNKGY
ncbi:FapA family protein [Fervidobacterium sp.]